MSYGSSTNDQDLTTDYSDTVEAAVFFGATSLRAGKGAIYVESAGNDYDGKSTDFASYSGGATANFSVCGDGANAGNYKVGCYETSFEPSFQSPYIIGVGALNANGTKAVIQRPGRRYGSLLLAESLVTTQVILRRQVASMGRP